MTWKGKCVLPPTNYADVTHEAPIGVAKTPITVDRTPAAEPGQGGGGVGLGGKSGNNRGEGLCGGQPCCRGNGGGGGTSGARWHWDMKELARCELTEQACVCMDTCR